MTTNPLRERLAELVKEWRAVEEPETDRFLCVVYHECADELEQLLSETAPTPQGSEPKLHPAFWRTKFVEQFRRDLIAGLIVKESDGEPWPYTEREAQQVADSLYERLATEMKAAPTPLAAVNVDELARVWAHDALSDGLHEERLRTVFAAVYEAGRQAPAPTPESGAGLNFDARSIVKRLRYRIRGEKDSAKVDEAVASELERAHFTGYREALLAVEEGRERIIKRAVEAGLLAGPAAAPSGEPRNG